MSAWGKRDRVDVNATATANNGSSTIVTSGPVVTAANGFQAGYSLVIANVDYRINILSTSNTIILDTETNGKNKIVQISYYILNESNDVTNKYDFFLNDGTHTIDFFKKFNTEFIKSNGIDVQIVLKKLASDLLHCKRIVCHNTQFDIGKLTLYFTKYNIEYKFPDDIYCTMVNSRNIVGAKNKNGQIKNTKLGELCMHFNVIYDENIAHD
jgi:DNA polymerase III epsilon subunit-like protein